MSDDDIFLTPEAPCSPPTPTPNTGSLFHYLENIYIYFSNNVKFYHKSFGITVKKNIEFILSHRLWQDFALEWSCFVKL